MELLSKNKFTLFTFLILMLLLVVQYCLFYHEIIFYIAKYYPPGIDQALYLYQSFQFALLLKQKGLLQAWHTYTFIPTTFLFPIQAGIWLSFFGITRLSALTFNFCFFAILQCVVFYTLAHRLHFYRYGFLFLGLLFSSYSFFSYGGAVDFRIDFMVLCVYGIWICFVINSDFFFKKTWLLPIILLTVYLILLRFLTVAYLGLLCSIFFCYLLFCLRHFSKLSYKNKIRLKNLLLFGVITGLVVSPILYYYRHLLFQYYVIGHVIGDEKVMRAKIAGVNYWYQNLFYYPSIFIRLHLGAQNSVRIFLVLLFFFGVSRLVGLKKKNKVPKTLFFFLSFSILVPLFILTLDKAKSSNVINVILIPTLMLCTILLANFFKKIKSTFSNKLSLSLISLFFTCGCYEMVLNYHWSENDFYFNTRALQNINQLTKDIGQYARAKKWTSLKMVSLQCTDFFAAIPTVYFEQTKYLFLFKPLMGAFCQNPVISYKEAIAKKNEANIFLLQQKNYQPNHFSLFENSIQNYRKDLLDTIIKNKKLLGRYDINKIKYNVYVNSF